MAREGPEEEQGKLKRFDITPTRIVSFDEEKRIEMMMRLASQAKINRRFYKIDAESCRIVDIIGSFDPDFPRNIMLNATPETLIHDKIAQTCCRTAICLVKETSETITTKFPITINGKTTLQTISFRPGRKGRGDDINTVIAYTDQNISAHSNGGANVDDFL